MALEAKTKQILDIAMGSKAAADALVAKMTADGTLSSKELRELEIALADKKSAEDIMAAIDAASGSISDRSNRALKNAMITSAASADMKAEIEG